MNAPAARPRADARPARPTRPAAPPLPAFEALDRTHREMLEMLAEFDGLLAHVERDGPDADARERAGRILDFFNRNAREHHAQEEAVVFPALLAGPDPALAAHVRRLQQDHGWLEEDWIELAPQIEAIAGGYNWYDIAMLRQALPTFKALLEEHIGLEESLVYPAARRHQATLAEGQAERAAPRGD